MPSTFCSVALSLFLVSAGIAAPATSASAQTKLIRLCVGMNGNDANVGTQQRPFATLTRARDAVRALKAKGLHAPVEVVIRGGVCCLTKPLVLTPQDSGTARCPITWRAAKGEHVVICSGRRITQWKRYRGGICVADLKAQGLGCAQFHQLFYPSGRARNVFAQRQILARFPNFDPKHPRTGGSLYAAETAPKPTEHLIYEPGAIPFDRWRHVSEAELVAVYHGWMFAITPIRRVDRKTRTITFRRIRAPIERFDRFFIQNVLDALNAPGEWYHDRRTGLLYFYPPNERIRQGDVMAPVVDNIVELRGTIPYPFDYLNVAFKGPRDQSPLPPNPPPMNPVKYVTFRGLNFECARQDGLRMVGARHCQVVACRVTNVGNIGIDLDGVTSTFPEVGNPRVTPATGRATGGADGGGQILFLNDPCTNCRVLGCDVWATGCEGIMLLGADDLAENNHVWDIGLYAKDAPCINLLGERNVARRNSLNDCPRCAVFLKGVDNLVELNDVHHTCLETCDMGGIRMVQRNVHLGGNKIRFNRIIDTIGYGHRRGDLGAFSFQCDTLRCDSTPPLGFLLVEHTARRG